MNPDEFLAMLEPKSARWGHGRGGIPVLTAVDVAGALGMGEDRFATEVYLLTGSGRDGATRNAHLVDAMLSERQLDAWRERETALITAQLGIEQARLGIVGQWMARQRLAGARAGRWPHVNDYPDIYAAIRKACVAEMRCYGTCSACHGSGTAIADALVVACPKCDGRGHSPITDSARIVAIWGWRGMTQADAHDVARAKAATYSRTWRQVYNWTHRELIDASARARAHLGHALAD